MKISQLIKALEESKAERGDVDVYFVNDQFHAEPIRWAGISVMAEGASFSGDSIGPVADGDEDKYDDAFYAVELQ